MLNLTDSEKRDIVRYIEEGKELPEKYKNGEYIRSKAPDWLNEILISEGWFPILDID